MYVIVSSIMIIFDILSMEGEGISSHHQIFQTVQLFQRLTGMMKEVTDCHKTQVCYKILSIQISLKNDCNFIQFVPKKLTNRRKKILTKIDSCGAKFSHEHDLGMLIFAWS